MITGTYTEGGSSAPWHGFVATPHGHTKGFALGRFARPGLGVLSYKVSGVCMLGSLPRRGDERSGGRDLDCKRSPLSYIPAPGMAIPVEPGPVSQSSCHQPPTVTSVNSACNVAH
jgi:hypothetical protein